MRIKVLGVSFLTVLAASGLAQVPDVFIRLDATLQYQLSPKESPFLKAYSPLGRFSTVALDFTLEPGFNIVVSQKFQRIPNDSDQEYFDEYFIEDKGYWRLGKQYIPFGRSIVMRESAYAATIHLTIGEKAFPLILGYADSQEGKPKGMILRLGGRFGISVVEGHNFGSGATSLTVIRLPEESLGRGHGYERAIGFDGKLSYSKEVVLTLDHVSFRRGETPEDKLLDVTDVSATWTPNPRHNLTLGLTHEWKSVETYVRLTGQITVRDGVTLEPFLRFKEGKFHDASLSLRIKP